MTSNIFPGLATLRRFATKIHRSSIE